LRARIDGRWGGADTEGMKLRGSMIVSAALVAAFSWSSVAWRGEGEPERLDERLAGWVTEYAQPGIAAAVFDDGGMLAVGVAGVREMGKESRLEESDRLHVGSCTKAMTATMVATLVEEGVLWWEMPLEKAFAKMAGEMLEAWRSVTLEQALHHRAGLPAFTAGDAPEFALAKDLEGTPREQRREFVRRLLTRAPEYAAGEKFVYSNADYALVASAAEEATGMGWEALMNERVFGPVEMTEAGFGWPATVERPWAPLGHIQGAGGLSALAIGHPYRLPACLAPSGDVHCSITDFARFAQFHLAGVRGTLAPRPGHARPLISQRNFMAMHMPAAPLREYAMGWVPARSGENMLSWHNGSAGTFFALMTLDPDNNRGVVVVTNAGTGEKACTEITRALLERYKPGAVPKQ